MFPNKHAVYFHDTPTKHLFNKKVRAYSHGCMRVRNPMKMATVLLGHDKGWERDRIDQIVASGIDNNRIYLEQKYPVHVTYFTARANQDGEIELTDDIYGHEELIQKGFDGLAHTIVKEDRSLDKFVAAKRPSEGYLASNSGPASWFLYQPQPTNRDTRWRRNVFGFNDRSAAARYRCRATATVGSSSMTDDSEGMPCDGSRARGRARDGLRSPIG